MIGTLPLPYGRICDICKLWSTKLIFVGYSQPNYTTVLDFFALGIFDTSYFNMPHLGAARFIVLTQVFARF